MPPNHSAHVKFQALLLCSLQCFVASGQELSSAGQSADGSLAIQHFESQVRPVLIASCLECHSVETEASGGLLLDSRDGWMAGGDSGPAIVVGDAAASRVLQAIRYDHPDLQMPPDGKLPMEVIEAFERWINEGALDPRRGMSSAERQTGLPVDRAQEHWAYRPIIRLAPPKIEPSNAAFSTSPPSAHPVSGASGVSGTAAAPNGEGTQPGSSPPAADLVHGATGATDRSGSQSSSDFYSADSSTGSTLAICRESSIDSFIDVKLKANDLQPLPRASAPVLVRRLYFDLTGLPPSADQIRDFLNSDSPLAYEELVDRLLASPRFGEHFARRWMDVARYADSITLRGFVLPQAWRYRDYLIEAFMEDRPFDQMIHEQLAGDQMASSDLGQRQKQLVATGFLALGNTNLEQQDKTQLEMDFIDEQLEVICRAFLGQTIGCARCHDHKFDPIPTRDYYALAGIFRSAVAMDHDNVSKWIEEPLPLSQEDSQAVDRIVKQIAELDPLIADLKKRLNQVAAGEVQSVRAEDLPGIIVDDADAKLVGTWATSSGVKPYVGQSYAYAGKSEVAKTATLEPAALPPGEYEVRLAYTPHQNRATNTCVTVFSADGEKELRINQQAIPAYDSLWVSLGNYRFEKNGQAYVLVSNDGANGTAVVDAVQFLPLDLPERPAEANIAGHRTPESNDPSQEESWKAELKRLESRRKALQSQMEERPKYLTVIERGPSSDIPIHIRGDVHNLGEVVPRGFLTAIEPKTPASDLDSHGRLQFAEWLTSEQNPLTARVYANRVWLWLMGQGIVATSNNFGTTANAPSHPELLDWLASELIESGWSTKKLVRTIVLSAAYKRASQPVSDAAGSIRGDVAANSQGSEVDPNNRWYWRGQQRRLHVEALRDAMLTFSGELEHQFGGSLIRAGTKADYNYPHQSTRRSIYHPVFRNSLPELYEVFDFADSSVSIGERPRSTVATQALVLLNHPWICERAHRAAERFAAVLCNSEKDNEQEWNREKLTAIIGAIYMEALGREVSPEEEELAVAFLLAAGNHSEMQMEHLEQLVHSLLASLDFRFLD